MDGTGYQGGSLMKAVFPLAGGALNAGSTCGVVSGGCLGLVLARAGGISSGGAAGEDAIYAELREYTRWFEENFGSTICSDRLGGDLAALRSPQGMKIACRMLTRCMLHAGGAVDHLVRSIGVAGSTSSQVRPDGLCGAPLFELAMEPGGLDLHQAALASVALDGGIGLSGGLCGALAALLMIIGDEYGVDPREAGVAATVRVSMKGVFPAPPGQGRTDSFSIGLPIVHRFDDEFGSVECGRITSRSFETGGQLRDHLRDSRKCSAIGQWCRGELSTLLERQAIPRGSKSSRRA